MILSIISCAFLALPIVVAFQPVQYVYPQYVCSSNSQRQQQRASTSGTTGMFRLATADSSSSVQSLLTDDVVKEATSLQPQAMASGYSQAMDMQEAIQEAVAMAIEALPPLTNQQAQHQIDLAFVSVSSLYDGSASPADVVPSILKAAKGYGKGIQHLVGSTCGGFIGSRATFQPQSTTSDVKDADEEDAEEQRTATVIRACKSAEQEGVPGVSVVLSILPDVQVETFHVEGDDVPDDYGKVSKDTWRHSIGLASAGTADDDESKVVFLLPSPAFSNDLDDLLQGLVAVFEQR